MFRQENDFSIVLLGHYPRERACRLSLVSIVEPYHIALNSFLEDLGTEQVIIVVVQAHLYRPHHDYADSVFQEDWLFFAIELDL